MSVMFSSSRLFDEAMVDRYCEENDLEYLPPTEPPNAISNGATILVVDRHSWGKVYYAEHLDDDRAATWIERNDVRPTLPPWIEDVRSMVNRPDCLGFHEGDFICDGGINPQTGITERPCRWRDVCKKVQKAAGGVAKVEHYLARRTDHELWKLTQEKPGRWKPDYRRLRPRDDPVRVTSEQNLAQSTELVWTIFRRACAIGKWEEADSRFTAIMGQFFVVEHDRETRNPIFRMFRRRPRSFVSGVLTRDSGTEQSIARFLPHSEDALVTIQINTNEVEMVRAAVPHLRVDKILLESKSRTPFRPYEATSLRSVNPTDVDTVAHILVGVVEGGLLCSWGIGTTDPDRPGFGIGRWKSGRVLTDKALYRQKRDEFLAYLRSNGWVPGRRKGHVRRE